MKENFWITHQIERVDCGLPSDDSNASFEGFLEHVMTGTAVIGFGEKSVRIPSCGLLALSRSLIRLLTFPVLYGVEAFETVLDYDTDFCSKFEHESIALTIVQGRKDQVVFVVSIGDALRTVGTFHRSLLSRLMQTCPTLREHGTLLVRIPDAFALAPMLKSDS